MFQDDSEKVLLDRWRSGDEAAAAELYRRYAERLIALARKKIGPRLARRVEAADISQSVFRTFFRRSRDGQFVIDHAQSLWHLLACITIHKVLKQVEWHNAGRRDLTLEVDDGEELLRHVIAREPTPEDAAAFLDELNAVLIGLDDRAKEILRLRLEGHSVREIGDRIGCCHTTVSRTLSWLGHRLEQRLNP